MIGVFGGLAAGGVTGCTLTSDGFEPEQLTSEVLGAAAGASGAAPIRYDSVGPEPAPGSCTEDADCRARQACLAGACVSSDCAGAEDIATCELALCPEGDCGARNCFDGEIGPGESDVDCGGSCAPCVAGASCGLASDCASGVCSGARCAEPSCDDRVRNGDESSVDCGGTTCPACAVGSSCAADADCEPSAFCSASNGVCTPSTCQDGVLNGAEIAADCGGGACPGCAVGSACRSGDDCSSGVCGVAATCAAPSCDDGVRNGDEVGTDCGGSCAERCGTGVTCESGADCQSGVCGATGCALEGQCCQPPTCDDGIRNGTEPVPDCGDEQCGPCAVGDTCTDDVQCETGSCFEGACVPLVCGDGQRNGDEAGADCGGTEPGCPPCPRCNEDNSTDMGSPGTVSSVPANGCIKISQFPGYSPTLLESFESGPFPVGFAVRQECSGQFGGGSFDRPFHQNRMTGLTTTCPVIIELLGSASAIGVRYW